MKKEIKEDYLERPDESEQDLLTVKDLPPEVLPKDLSYEELLRAKKDMYQADIDFRKYKFEMQVRYTDNDEIDRKRMKLAQVHKIINADREKDKALNPVQYRKQSEPFQPSMDTNNVNLIKKLISKDIPKGNIANNRTRGSRHTSGLPNSLGITFEPID